MENISFPTSMATFFRPSALPVRIWAGASAACSPPPCMYDVLSELWHHENEGHVWALTQGTFSWPGPDHRENSFNDTPSSSFYSSSRCPQKMFRGKIFLYFQSGVHSASLADGRILRWRIDLMESGHKNKSHFRFTSTFADATMQEHC